MTSEVDTPPQSFEDALAELENLVDTLEQGQLTLEESLAAFERGIKLTRTCQKALDEAEQKVRILTDESEDAEPVPFENGDQGKDA
jgi:exodeoxyribonuclease VII small subunit